MGEAAGVAATLSVDAGVDVRDVDVRALQSQLVKQGGIVDRLTRPGTDADTTAPTVELDESIHWQAVDAVRAYD
jgi:hypothetical protein